MNLDKFYTSPEISKKFVEIINEKINLEDFDYVLEPSAGSGNILKYLPKKNRIGIDIAPEHKEVNKQDFFNFNFFDYNPIKKNVNIAVVGNPPFGKGYMNPLAKQFFNTSAKYCTFIAFIVPAKWHTSWKIHRQLDKNFGLYYSEYIPKNSFIKDGEIYDVNCCMQIWSKKSLGKNLRILNRPPTTHEDFEMFLTCDNVKKRIDAMDKLSKGEYWDFGLRYWGNIGVREIKDIPKNTTTHYLIKSKKDYVRKIFDNINWKKYVNNMGAPNMGGKSILVKAYEDTKKLYKGVDI